MSREAVIFIPDISGYTSFVNDTEIEHSQHIISELLEIILSADQLGLSVSEIEGDAVLSYKLDELPSVEALVEQCRQTFIRFHNHVKRYEAERICRCGACKAAIHLSLKFIIRFGSLDFVRVREHETLYGSDVILAHKLMKNSVPDSEYILFSGINDLISNDILVKKHPWIEVNQANDVYENIGAVDYQYVSLKPVHQFVSDPDPITIPGLGPDKLSFQIPISASMDTIYENFTNFDKRVEWNEEIREILLRSEKINKAGAMHTCLVGQNSLEIQAIGRVEDNATIVYGERLERFKGLRDILTLFTFTKNAGHTLVSVEIDFQAGTFLARLLKPAIRKMLMNQTKKGLQKLKTISEKNTD